MCGRYASSKSPDDLIDEFDIIESRVEFPIASSWNVAPTDETYVVMERGEHRNIYHIGTDEEVPIAEVARLVGQYFDREVDIVPGELTQGSTPRRCPNIGKLQALVYRPRGPLREGLTVLARWYCEHAHQAPGAGR